jgi:hypothetical protein
MAILLTGPYTRLLPVWTRKEADAQVQQAIKLLQGMGWSHFAPNPKDTIKNNNVVASFKSTRYEQGLKKVAMVRIFNVPKTGAMHVDIQLS